ncbi:MAG: AAA family ATPase [Dehalococcoidia bacterium]|jgi:hypothetical protein
MVAANDYVEQADGTWKLKNQRINQINPIQIVDDSISQQTISTLGKRIGLLSAKEILQRPIEPLTPLWGPFIYKGSVILLNGRTGVGKSTFLYNLFVSAATGKPFAGIPFDHPLKVIYSDRETPFYLKQLKLQRICDGDGPDNLLFVPRELASFQNNLKTYKEMVMDEHADILGLDTISEAFNTKDENDNAEAIRQFCMVRDFSLDTGCVVIATHHTGRNPLSETDVFAGRGATARADKVDIVLNLFPLKEDSNILCLAIGGKDKIAGNDSKLYLRKAGNDSFEVVERQETYEATTAERCKEFILASLDHQEISTSQIQTECQKAGFSQPTVTRVIGALVDTAKLRKTRRGYYQKIESSTEHIGFDDLILDSKASGQAPEAN